MRIDLVGTSLPGRSCSWSTANGDVRYDNVHVGLQDKAGNVVDRVTGDAAVARWSLDVDVVGGEPKGPFVHGKKGDRFFYLCWGVVDGDAVSMFRRAKLMWSAVPVALHTSAVLTGEITLTMKNGTPLCAAVRPPVVSWR